MQEMVKRRLRRLNYSILFMRTSVSECLNKETTSQNGNGGQDKRMYATRLPPQIRRAHQPFESGAGGHRLDRV